MTDEPRIRIEMTGKDDANAPWNIALCGFPGAGKTLFSSTAADPLFLFFAENPRMKSLRNRFVPHVKLVNSVNDTGGLVMSVQDKIQVIANHILMDEEDTFKTLVVDTGDEMFQAMKEGRRIKQGGEFEIGDWSWIGDAYREVITSLIDLPLNLIVLYHVKSTSDGEDGIVREFMLQGAPKDEAAGWFDVVGAVDTYVVVNEDGDNETRRTILTQPSRLYPFLKDHSGLLPRRFDISRDFVGDFERMLAYLHGDKLDEVPPEQEHQVLKELIPPSTEPKRGAKIPIPTPMQLADKKAETASLVETIKQVNEEKQKIEDKVVQNEQDSGESSHQQEGDSEVSPEGSSDVAEEKTETQQNTEEKEPGPDINKSADLSEDAPSVPEEEGGEPEEEGEEASPEDKEGDTEPQETEEETVDPEALIVKELGAEEVTVYNCAECGEVVDDENLRALTEIRFRKILCRKHFKETLEASKN